MEPPVNASERHPEEQQIAEIAEGIPLPQSTPVGAESLPRFLISLGNGNPPNLRNLRLSFGESRDLGDLRSR